MKERRRDVHDQHSIVFNRANRKGCWGSHLISRKSWHLKRFIQERWECTAFVTNHMEHTTWPVPPILVRTMETILARGIRLKVVFPAPVVTPAWVGRNTKDESSLFLTKIEFSQIFKLSQTTRRPTSQTPINRFNLHTDTVVLAYIVLGVFFARAVWSRNRASSISHIFYNGHLMLLI